MPQNQKQYFNCIPFVDVPELNLTNLTKELKTLTKPVEFGIALGIPQHVLETIEADKPHSECMYCINLASDTVIPVFQVSTSFYP